VYDPSDNPFEYYKAFQDNPVYEKDFAQFSTDIVDGTLPAVSFIKALGTATEHPGISSITTGESFVRGVVNDILNSSLYAENTLILVVPDESGGFYDHVAPPATSTVDKRAYGPRLPLLALGYFAKPNTISHVTMEHSSIVRFIEWNFLAGPQGQLQTRDATVNNIGSLLDASKTGATVPTGK
jgi:phospholipase C